MASGEAEKRFIKSNSRTYFWSSKLLPKKYRADIFALYTFVRTSRDFVNCQPVRARELLKFEADTQKALSDPSFDQIAHSWDSPEERACKHIVRLTHKYKFDPSWVHAFFHALKQDIDHKGYATIDDSLKYVYGAAEVIGLMTAKILGVPADSYEAFQLQARAILWIDFVRDIETHNQLGRLYFPRNDLRAYNLKDLSHETVLQKPSDFKRFIGIQLKRYYKWQEQADALRSFLPSRYQEGAATASRLYRSMAKKIEKRPLSVFDKKVRPHRIRLLWEGTKRATHKTAKLLAAQEKLATKK